MIKLKQILTEQSSAAKTEFLIAQKIAADLEDKIYTNPDTYFSDYRSLINDSEALAHNWLSKYWNKTHSANIKKLQNSKFDFSKKNAQYLIAVRNIVLNSIMKDDFKPYSFGILDTKGNTYSNAPIKTKRKVYNITWSYFKG